jgi:hypothetical protein
MEPAVVRARERRPDNSWGQRIYDTLFGDITPVINAVPYNWLFTTDRIRIAKVADQPCGMEFTFTRSKPWPYQFQPTTLAAKCPHLSNLFNINLTDHPAWGEFYAEVVIYRERVDTAVARQREFVDMVKAVCTGHTTLASALKVWPPLWDLIPEEYKEKHQARNTYTKAEVVLDVDIEKLTTMSTAAKLGL